jgi:hypothetical protein
MKKSTVIIIVVLLAVCSSCKIVGSIGIAPNIKTYRKFERVSPEQLVQALDTLFEQYPEHRISCEVIEYRYTACKSLPDCEERQRCYFQQESESPRREDSIFRANPEIWKAYNKLKVKPIGVRHSFSFSNSPDTAISITIDGSILYDNKYANLNFGGFYDMKAQKAYHNGVLSYRQRKQALARFESDILPKIREILKENSNK